jgi:predicted amidohydrolase YtcJ
MNARVLTVAALLGGAALPFSTQDSPRHVDRIFVNGSIWTGDDSRPRASALAIGGGSIVGVGSDAEVRALGAADTTIVDLRGRLVVPGFQDSHLHLPGASVNHSTSPTSPASASFSSGFWISRDRIRRCHGSPAVGGDMPRFPTSRSTRRTSTK